MKYGEEVRREPAKPRPRPTRTRAPAGVRVRSGEGAGGGVAKPRPRRTRPVAQRLIGGFWLRRPGLRLPGLGSERPAAVFPLPFVTASHSPGPPPLLAALRLPFML